MLEEDRGRTERQSGDSIHQDETEEKKGREKESIEDFEVTCMV